ncbi:MAG: UPF0175 family protein [Chloroflexota bacterium]|nr:UPF0175 family protein [Chloroflexota bacterium]
MIVRPRDLVEAHLYENEEAVILDALRHLLRTRADLRIQLAIHRYQTTNISLSRAASMAGLSWAQMKDILVEHGIQPRLGTASIKAAQEEIATLHNYFKEQ